MNNEIEITKEDLAEKNIILYKNEAEILQEIKLLLELFSIYNINNQERSDIIDLKRMFQIASSLVYEIYDKYNRMVVNFTCCLAQNSAKNKILKIIKEKEEHFPYLEKIYKSTAVENAAFVKEVNSILVEHYINSMLEKHYINDATFWASADINSMLEKHYINSMLAKHNIYLMLTKHKIYIILLEHNINPVLAENYIIFILDWVIKNNKLIDNQLALQFENLLKNRSESSNYISSKIEYCVGKIQNIIKKMKSNLLIIVERLQDLYFQHILFEYEKKINDLMKKDSPKIFGNYSLKRARIITNLFVASAEKSVVLLSGSFPSDFYNELKEIFLLTAKRFYKNNQINHNNECSIRIISVNDNQDKSTGLDWIKQSQDEELPIYYENISSNNGDKFYHFLIVDDKRYRLEKQYNELKFNNPPYRLKAEVCCNDAEKCKDLKIQFENLWNNIN